VQLQALCAAVQKSPGALVQERSYAVAAKAAAGRCSRLDKDIGAAEKDC
jgi:hypothetical protein